MTLAVRCCGKFAGRMISLRWPEVTVGGLPGLRLEGALVNLDGIRVVAWITGGV